jgi:hypothetical protein
MLMAENMEPERAQQIRINRARDFEVLLVMAALCQHQFLIYFHKHHSASNGPLLLVLRRRSET